MSIDPASRSDLESEKSPPKLQKTGVLSHLKLNDTRLSLVDDQDEAHEKIVWELGPLLEYQIRNEKPQVLVPWYPTWEPPDEYPSVLNRPANGWMGLG